MEEKRNMLYIIVGPSGSGKTTFIKLALRHNKNCKVIPVDVCSSTERHYETDLGRRKISTTDFDQNHRMGRYSCTCIYLNSKYGFAIPTDYENKDVVYLLDYPGEYPDCFDIKMYHWKGFLILPPSVEILKHRLLMCKRTERIDSAIKEYYECLDDIKENHLNDTTWSIIINDDMSSIQNSINNYFI